jgi:hypothetical protein
MPADSILPKLFVLQLQAHQEMSQIFARLRHNKEAYGVAFQQWKDGLTEPGTGTEATFRDFLRDYTAGQDELFAQLRVSSAWSVRLWEKIRACQARVGTVTALHLTLFLSMF